MGDNAKGTKWAWQVGDEAFHLQIPVVEHNPLPPLNVVQGRYATWQTKIQPNWVPDLYGRRLEEVEREVGWIKLGDNFTPKKQFNHCLQSWCELNDHVNHRVST